MKYIELNLKEFGIAILRKGAFILIGALVFAGLFAMMRPANYSVEELVTPEQIAEVENQLNATQASKDRHIVWKWSMVKDNSQINPYQIKTIFSTYKVSVDPAIFTDENGKALPFMSVASYRDRAVQNVTNQYAALARQAPLAELFEKAGIDPQAYSATVDLVNVNLDDQERAAVADGILVVRIYGTDLVDGSKIALAMTDYLNAQTKAVEKASGYPHTLTLLNQTSSYSFDYRMIEKQNRRRDNIIGCDNEIGRLDGVINGLNENLEQLKRKAEDSTTLEQRTAAAQKSQRIKDGMLGLVVALVIGILLAAFVYINRLTLQTPAQAQQKLGVRYLGGVRRRRGLLFGLLADALAGHYLLSEEANAMDLIAANAAELLGNQQKLLVTGSLPLKEMEAVAKKLSSTASLKGKDVVVAACVNESAEAVKKLAETDAVLLVERLCVSRLGTINGEVERIGFSGKTLLGYILY